MAGGLSYFAANKVMDYLMKDTGFTVPSSYWVAAFTVQNGGNLYLKNNNIASATEVSTSGTAYTRIETKGATGIDYTTAANGATETDADIVWATATAAWGDIWCVALMDSATVGAGNVWWWYDLTAAKSISAPDVLRISTGFLDLTFFP